MNVLYTCDNNYIWLMGISVTSLFENNKHIDELNVYLLGESITAESKGALNKIAEKYKRKILIMDVPKLDIPSSIVSARWPLSAFTRLYSGQLLPDNIDRILYLDCDTIISGDLAPLDHLSFDGNIILGVKDCISGTYKKNIGLDGDSPYINAGVLLFDLAELRKVDINKEIEAYIKKYIKLINYADQDILNGIFKGRVGVISPCYNVMTIDVAYSYEEIMTLRRPTNFYLKTELNESLRRPAIIHYTTNMLIARPWYSNADHPLTHEFRKYMEMSLWKDRKLRKMVFSSDESKIISVLSKLPKSLSFNILGLLHSELKPRYIKFRSR